MDGNSEFIEPEDTTRTLECGNVGGRAINRREWEKHEI